MAMLKLLIIFIIIIALLLKRKPIGPVMLVGSLLLGLFYQMAPVDFGKTLLLSITDYNTISFVVVIIFVMLLEAVMSECGSLDKMLSSLGGLFCNRRVNIAVPPALIGLLPSAGGALFSAPLVRQAAGRYLSNHDTAFINNYYRHIIEIFFPTYPAVLLACALSHTPVATFMLALFPFTLLHIVIGNFLLKKVPKQIEPEENHPSRLVYFKEFISGTWPLLLLIFLILAFSVPIHWAASGCFMAAWLFNKIPLKKMGHLAKASLNWKIVLMTVSVMLFKDVLAASGAVQTLPELLAELPIPQFIVFALMFLLVGAITGMMLPTIAMCLPLALTSMPEGGLPLIAMLCVFSHIGNMISPMHLCVAISCQYFNSPFTRQFKMSIIPYGIIGLVAIAVYLIANAI